MKTKQSLWLLEPARYHLRIELRFTESASHQLRSKVWDCHWSKLEPPQILLIQADAKSAECALVVNEVGRNSFLITTAVAGLQGGLTTTAFSGFRPEAVRRQMAAHPVTLGLVANASGVHVTLHVRQSTPSDGTSC